MKTVNFEAINEKENENIVYVDIRSDRQLAKHGYDGIKYQLLPPKGKRDCYLLRITAWNGEFKAIKDYWPRNNFAKTDIAPDMSNVAYAELRLGWNPTTGAQGVNLKWTKLVMNDGTEFEPQGEKRPFNDGSNADIEANDQFDAEQ